MGREKKKDMRWRLGVLACAIVLIASTATAQQLPIVVQRDNAPPVSVFSLNFLIPNRAFFVASGEWVYATYDSVAPGQFAAAAAITFGIGNFDSFIQRLVWFDAITGRVDYDGHASTTVFLPCNATYRLLLFDQSTADAPLLLNTTLRLTSCNNSHLPFHIDAAAYTANAQHDTCNSDGVIATWTDVPVYLGRTANAAPVIPASALPTGRMSVRIVVADPASYGRTLRTLRIEATLRIDRAVTELQRQQENRSIIYPSLATAADLFPLQRPLIVSTGSAGLNALDPVTFAPTPFVNSSSAFNFTTSPDGVAFRMVWSTHQTCDSRMSFTIRLNTAFLPITTSGASLFRSGALVWVRTPVRCRVSTHEAALRTFSVEARRVTAPPAPFLIRDALNRTWSAQLDVENVRVSIFSNNTRHLLFQPHVIVTNVSFPLVLSPFTNGPWFIQRAVVSYAPSGEVVVVEPVEFVQIRGTRGAISFAANERTAIFLRCDATTTVFFESNTTTPGLVGPYIFEAACLPTAAPIGPLCGSAAAPVDAGAHLVGLVTLVTPVVAVLGAVVLLTCYTKYSKRA